MLSRSHSLSSSRVARLGMRSACSSGLSGVFASEVGSWGMRDFLRLLEHAFGFAFDLVLYSRRGLVLKGHRVSFSAFVRIRISASRLREPLLGTIAYTSSH